MSDHLTVFYNPIDEIVGGELIKRWQSERFIPTFEDFNRNDWEGGKE